MRRSVVAALSVAVTAIAVSAASAHVLRVGTYKGIPGQFSSIQAAVDAAKPGDWVLIGPGDYKTTSSRTPTGGSDFPAGVLIDTPHVWLRGMNRNTVIVDGTKSGPKCSSNPADQNFGPASSSGPTGLNGVMVWKVGPTWVQNMTVCNFLGGSGDAGNEFWWNGGGNSGAVGNKGYYYGDYLTATTTFFQNEATAATYGIFSSNWSGGEWNHTYSSNFNDSDYYIGACRQICDQVVNDAHGEYSALGYSGSNSGGSLVVKNSEFDNNQDGFDTNSQNGDNPPPQNGACPNNGTSPITHTHSCWVFIHNYVHDNNNPNIPSAGSAAAGPVGTGMSISGGRNDTVMDNSFANNGGWGIIFVPYPDSGPPCTGGTQTNALCIYDESGDALLNNQFKNDGGFGNPTNGDLGLTNLEPGPTDCFSGNIDPGPNGFTSAPSNVEQTYPTCNGATVPPSDANPQSAQFLSEVACDSQITFGGLVPLPCLPTDHYPRRTQIVMHPLPPTSETPTMPNPCAGVPTNPWCGGQVTTIRGCPRATGRLRGHTLGLLTLGTTRAQARHAYTQSSDRGKHYEDFFCLTPIGVRVGYASPALLKTLSAGERRRFAGRVVWASTSDSFYKLRGVRPGATLAAARKHLKLTDPFHIGLNFWYLTPNGSSTGVLKVRHGIVEEIGIAVKSLTKGHKAQIVFLKSFS